MTAQPSGRRWRQALARRLRDERGYTLIELMIASVAGIIVTAALGAIVISTVKFSSNFTDRVDANQEGAVAMEKITQALNSSCVASQVPPVVSTGATGSYVTNDTQMYFYSSLTDGPVITPNLDEVALTNGQLVINTYAANPGGSAPSPTNTNPWTFVSTAFPSFTLLPDATQTVNSSGTVPVFQYFGYSGGTLSSTAYATPLSAADAATTAEVVISFRSLPSDNNTTTNRGADLTNSVVLRLTPASANTGATNIPCS
jgi:Tfp pilus assembly protein PilW